jgi:predicted ATPase
MPGKRLIQTVELKNLLSFGPESAPVELRPLNVLIGLNACGKSNFIEAIGLMAAAPRDLLAPIRQGGGVGEWLWKGGQGNPKAEINATIYYPDGIMPLRYRIEFTLSGQRFELINEVVENERVSEEWDNEWDQEDCFYRYRNGFPMINVKRIAESTHGEQKGRASRRLKPDTLDPSQSVLSQRRDPDQYPELTYIAQKLSGVRFFREWNLGRYTSPRLPQNPDLPQDFLLEDASNLGLVLNDILHHPELKRNLLEKLTKFYEEVEDIDTHIRGGTVQIFFHERGLRHPVPATRLSDGTLRYLCLLSILCHPNPPPLICIEEPELGMHPDILPTIADLLVEASERTQLIVTTHSDILVSQFKDNPESVLICERDIMGTSIRRRDRESLSRWLEKYSLGELWLMGELGGTK